MLSLRQGSAICAPVNDTYSLAVPSFRDGVTLKPGATECLPTASVAMLVGR